MKNLVCLIVCVCVVMFASISEAAVSRQRSVQRGIGAIRVAPIRQNIIVQQPFVQRQNVIVQQRQFLVDPHCGGCAQGFRSQSFILGH